MKVQNIKPKRIVFTGYYGMSNFGDDLFGLVCARGAARFWSKSKSSVLSTSIKGADSGFTIPSWFNRDLYASSGHIGAGARLMFALYEASRSQMFILGGGSVLSSQASGVRDFIYKTASVTKVRFSALGISIGPFENVAEEQRVKEFLSCFEYISVRDLVSYQFAKSFALDCPIVMAGDLAGLMPILFDNKNEDVKKGVPVLGISLCNYESVIGGDKRLERERNNALIDAVIVVAKRFGARVEVFSLNNHPQIGDDILAQSICSFLKKENVEFNLNRHVKLGVCEVWNRISCCDAFVSVRLHGAIAAYQNNVPFTLIEYHKKCTDFLDDVGQSMDLRLSANDTDSVKVEAVIENLFLQPSSPTMSSMSYSERAYGHFLYAPWKASLAGVEC